MLCKSNNFFAKTLRSFSTASTAKSIPNSNWRIQIKQAQLVSQISNILLQRHTKFWPSLLNSLKISSIFTPLLFHRVLDQIQNNPHVSLDFFNWAKGNLDYKPDLTALCKLTRILFSSGLSEPVKPILAVLVEEYPPGQIVCSLVQSCKGANFNVNSSVISCVLECYCRKSSYFNALEVYQKGREYGISVSVHGCNAVFSLLLDKNELRLAWCFYGSMVRIGIPENQFTWDLIARIFCKNEKFERVVMILEMGMRSSVIYNLMIECYSNKGSFDAAFGFLNEMCNKGIEPSFSTYSSILDGACKYQNMEVIEKVMYSMAEKEYVPEQVTAEYNSIIQRLSGSGKTYSADFFFKRVCDEKIELEHATYGHMLKALSVEGRVKDAIVLYCIISQRKIRVPKSCYIAFADALCRQNPSEEVSKLLVDIIGEGFKPSSEEVCRYINKQCDRRRWKEAEDLVHMILDKRCLIDSFSCCSLVKHYCSLRQIESAIQLHTKLKESGIALDATTYTVLLTGLFREGRVEDALGVFHSMRMHEVLSSESFSIMIRNLCQLKEFRKAMKLHDEMLELGLKPDGRTYKRLIAGFG